MDRERILLRSLPATACEGSSPRPIPMSETVRVRFAPSPTGRLHIGGARTALFNWAFARRTGGRFVLRIEDTDAERSSPEYERAIQDGLRWLGLDWDEGPEVGGDFGPYRQSERREEHLGVAARLFQAGWAYRCFCSPERLAELREAQSARKETPAYDGHCRELSDVECRRRMDAGETPVLRFRVPDGETRFLDLIRGDVAFQNREVDDWVMVRADGAPTYNFVVVCDDVHMRITHVIRGEEHLTNTPKQVLLYRALGLDPPLFAHLPLILGSDKKKLSKRTGDTALEDYRDKGFPPKAVLNFLCLQGWALDGATEIFSLDELRANFDVAKVSKGGSIFDLDKFLWLAGEYLRAETEDELAGHVGPFLVRAGYLAEGELQRRADFVRAAVATVRERARTYEEVALQLAYLFAPDDAVPFDQQALAGARKQGVAVLGEYRGWLAPKLAERIGTDALRDATKAFVAERGLKFPALFQPLRLALTGAAGGPDLFDVMALLGEERSLRRIEVALERLA